MTIGPMPKLGWSQLQKHSLIKSMAVPQSGAGLVPTLNWLSGGSDRFPEDVREAWQSEIGQLKLALEDCHLANQLTQWDKQNKVWLAIDELQNAVVQQWVTRSQYRDITWILLLHICHCALGETIAQHQFVHGLVQLCKSARQSSRYSEWSELWPYINENPVNDDVLKEFNKPVHLEFLTEVKRTREAPLTHPRVMDTVESLTAIRQPELTEPEKQQPQPTASTEVETPQEAEEPKEVKAAKFDIKPWASVFTSKAEFATRDDRLGLPTWNDLPDEHVLAICRACAPLLPIGNDQATYAAIVLLSLITGLNIAQTLEMPVQPNTEIYLDIDTGSIVFEASLLFDAKRKESSDQYGSERFRIPLPASLTELLKEWLDYSNGSVLRDIVPGTFGGKVDADIVEQVVAFLKMHGDPNYKAWPSKWAKSGAKFYLKTLKCELLAAVCSLSPQLCPPSALYYFHPSMADLQKAAEQVYTALGLGPTVVLEPSSEPQLGWPLTTESLTAGWSRIITDYLIACKISMAAATGDDKPLDLVLANFSQVATLAAAIVTFLHGGRGTKIEEMTWRSLLMHDTITHLHDKEIDDGRGSRLIPKPEQARRLLDWFLLAQSATTLIIFRRVTGPKNNEWRHFASGQAPLDAPLFNHVVPEAGTVRKVPVESTHIARIATQYFEAPRNFMRHAIVTTWPRVCKEDVLLKVVTGHGSATLELPSAYGPIAPVDIIRSAGEQLKDVLETWIPVSQVPEPPRKPEYRFDNLGLKRLLKGYAQYRRHFTDSAKAVYLSKWHLTATKFVEILRASLISDAIKRSKQADLVLHLLLIDLIHSEADLNAALASPRFTEIEGGYALAIDRHDSNGLTVIPLQTPTSVIVKAAQSFDPAGVDRCQEIWEELRSWLKETLKTCPWANVVNEKTQDAELLDQVLATVSLYADLHLPGAGQFAYEHDNNCVLFEPSSALGMLAGNRVFAGGAISTAMCPPPKPVVDDGVKAVVTAVGKACARGASSGPRKSDLTIYREALTGHSIAEDDSWGGVLNQCIEHNQHMPASSNGGRIEFSSTATYLTTIVRDLEPWVCTRPSEMTEEDFAHWSKQILCESLEQTKKKKGARTKERPAVTHARWFFNSMRALGFPIPESALKSGARKFQPTEPGRVVHTSSTHLDAALHIVKAWNVWSELDRLRAELAVRLLQENPLRWGEITYLQPKNITVLGDYLLICANRHNHIKSDDSWRYLPLTVETAQLYRRLSERIADSKGDARDEVFLFVDAVDKVVDAKRARTLHDQIQTALRFVTHNNEAKAHNLRASAGSRKCFESWETNLANWRAGVSGKQEPQVPEIRDRIYATERARRSFGHSSQQTSAYYYLYPAIFARQHSASRLLSEIAVPSHYLDAFNVTPAAIKKACQRDRTLGNDPWTYLARKMSLAKIEDAVPPREVNDPAVLVPSKPNVSQSNMVKYVGLRLLEGSKDFATNAAGLDVATVAQLEGLIAQIDTREVERLRKRAGGGIHGRTARGDIDCFNSTYFDALWKVFSKASDVELLSLSSFLTGRGNTVDWKERLIALGATYFATSQFRVELILKLSHRDPALAAELSAFDWLELGPPARDQGVHPTGKVYLGQKVSHVVRSHQWTAAKLFVLSLLRVRASLQTPQK